MKYRSPKITFAMLGAVCLAATVAYATNEYTYKPHEYALVEHGKSPNGHFSITTHGSGQGGWENFRVYLMAEPGHKKIGPLEEIDDPTDTAPDSYKAAWSPDSQYVIILYRETHQIMGLMAYRVENHRARFYDDSSLLDKFLGDRSYKMPSDAHVTSTSIKVRWKNAHQFILSENDYVSTGTKLALEKFARPFATTENNSPHNKNPDYYAHFSAAALCTFDTPKAEGYKVVNLTPKKPD